MLDRLLTAKEQKKCAVCPPIVRKNLFQVMRVQIPPSTDGGAPDTPEPPSAQSPREPPQGLLMMASTPTTTTSTSDAEPEEVRTCTVRLTHAGTRCTIVQNDEPAASEQKEPVNVDLQSTTNGNKRRKLRHVVEESDIENIAAVKAEQERVERLNKMKARQAEEDKRRAEIRSLETPSPPRDFQDEPCVEEVQFLEMRGNLEQPSTSLPQQQPQLQPQQQAFQFQQPSTSNDTNYVINNAQQQYLNYVNQDQNNWRRIVPPSPQQFLNQKRYQNTASPPGRRNLNDRPPPITPYSTKEQSDELDMWHLVRRAIHYSRDSQKNCKQRKLAELEDQMLAPCGRLRVSEVDSDVYFPYHLAQHLKPHQIAGVRFMYDNVIESVKVYPDSPGFGCILAHNMGLGKTLQVVTFCNVFFDIYRYTGHRHVFIVVPVNTIQNWASEFVKWSPEKSPDGTPLRNWKVFTMGDELKTRSDRVNFVQQWHQEGGVLIMGYEMLRLMQMKKNFSDAEKAKEFSEGSEIVKNCLFNPGPDVIICDEGHRIKNLKSETSTVLKSIKTQRRIILTGYPLQNNLGEYFCMVDFVRPGFLGTKKQFSTMFERPIQNGQCIDSTASDVSLAKRRTHVLTKILRSFVQRRGPMLLKMSLPPCREFVIYMRKSAVQRYLYRQFFLKAAEDVKTTGKSKYNPLSAFAICTRIWNHPDLLKVFVDRALSKQALKKMTMTERTATPKISTESSIFPNGITPGAPFGWNATNPMAFNNLVDQANGLNGPFAGSVLQQPYQPYSLSMNGMHLNGADNREDSKFGVLPGLAHLTGSAFVPTAGSLLGMVPGLHPGQNTVTNGSSWPGISLSYGSQINGTNEPLSVDNKPISIGNGISLNISSNGSVTPFNPKPAKSIHPAKTMKLDDDDEIDRLLSEESMFDWADSALGGTYKAGVVENSYKMQLAMELIDATTANNEKILLFSQSVKTLNVIEGFLKDRPLVLADGEKGTWKKNVTYMRFDGSTKGSERQDMIKKFNADDSVKLFLISTKAGSLGINLVSANRVILYDVSWNPCHDAQAVCRILRFGQTKETFVYRLVTDNSMERTIFKRQISKQGLQCKIVDEQAIQTNVSTSELERLMHYDEKLDLNTTTHDTTGWDLRDKLLSDVAQRFNHLLTGVPELYDSYIAVQEENITVEEREDAETWFAQQVQHLRPPSNGGPPPPPLLAPIPNHAEPQMHPASTLFRPASRSDNVPRLGLPMNSNFLVDNNSWNGFPVQQLNDGFNNIPAAPMAPIQNTAPIQNAPQNESLLIACTAVPDDFIQKLLTYKPYYFFTERAYTLEFKDTGHRIDMPLHTEIGYVKCRKGSFAIIEGYGSSLYVNVTSAVFKEVPKEVHIVGNSEIITLE